MITLRESIAFAEEKGLAIGHFNISNLEGIHAIVKGAEELNVPVIIGVSEGERKFTGVKEVVAIVKAIREKSPVKIFLNADHTHSLDSAKEAIDAGFDAVTADGSKLSIEDNIKFVRSVISYAKESGRDVIVEGELGYIGTSSEIHKEIPEDIKFDEKSLTDPEVATKFVRETGCDLIAPAVGNMHGMVGKGADPKLNIALIGKIHESSGVPIVLHGASGNTDEDIKSAIKNGVAIVHVNTELRVAFKEGVEEGLAEDPNEVAPYKYMDNAEEEMKKVVVEKLKLFNRL